MPEVNDLHVYAHGLEDLLLQYSCFSPCQSCGVGFKSEVFNGCQECCGLLQDVKATDLKAPQLVESTHWRAPGSNSVVSDAATVAEDHLRIASFSSRVTRRSSPFDNSSRVHRRSPPRRSPTSPYRTLHSQRGRPPNGSRQGRPAFRGVRQRRGVRGYLVEIRPPKWKRTIWLGTYGTDREAAGAYDAGIFYTKKKTTYNFQHLKGTFPPLPSHLRLDNDLDSDEIKLFVQKEARGAAARVKVVPLAEPCATPSLTPPSGPAAGAATTSSEECSEPFEAGSNDGSDDSFNLSMLESDFWLEEYAPFLEDLSFRSPSGCQMSNLELKQEISFDHQGLLLGS